MMRNLSKISKDKKDGLVVKEESLAVKKVKNLLDKLDQEGNLRCQRRGKNKWSNAAKKLLGP